MSLKINEKYKNYINEPFCYDGTIYDLLSVCEYNLGKSAESLYYLDFALKFDPDNERLIKNKEIIEDNK
ncbi:MAG: hypothetical protein HFH46_01665 [Bacilli bacterium]|nr:hypothetical protein [Bacilli bacterium]